MIRPPIQVEVFALFDYEGPSRLAYLFTTVVFDLKMMGLFSMLFGAGVLLYVKRGTLAGVRRRLAAVGQMAFSNYLFHSMTASVLFLGWGFGPAASTTPRSCSSSSRSGRCS